MIKRFTLLTLMGLVLFGTDLFSQKRLENKMTFYDAESWILFEDYKEALPKYLQLLQLYPSNANYKYRIGQCYINMAGEKDKAIPYLEEAVIDINPEYREGRFRETGAPRDALYHLANAYRITNQLDKAIETYKLFKENLDPDIYDSVIVNKQIESCLNAIDLMNNPLFIKEKNLGRIINEDNAEYNPVISADERILVFSRSEAFYEAMLYSTKNNGIWSSPVNLNELIKVDRDIYPTSISKDGRTLYIYNAQDYDGNIFSTVFDNGIWSPMLKLNDNINTKYWESHATISHDNKKLYFTSNRKGTYGGLDIFVSARDTSGNWGPAVNLGPVVNTPYNEDTPFLSEDDRTLFFSSRGHLNMGGYDIFYTTLQENGEWSVPRNIGYPVNTTDDDLFFKPVKNGHAGYMAKYNPDNYGQQDLYRIDIYSEEHPRIFQVMGLARGADLQSSVKISAVNKQIPDQELVVHTDPEKGQYEFEARHGDWDVTYESAGSEKLKTSINIPIRNPSDTFMLAEIILARDYSADFFVDPDSLITKDIDDSLHYENTDVPDLSDTSDKPVVKQPSEIPQYDRVITEIQSPPEPEIEKTISHEIEKTTTDNIVQESDITTTVQTDETGLAESQVPAGEKKNLKYLWLLLFATGFILILIIILGRRKNKDKN